MKDNIYREKGYILIVLIFDTDIKYIDLCNMRKYYVIRMTQDEMIVVYWNKILCDDNLRFVVLNQWLFHKNKTLAADVMTEHMA